MNNYSKINLLILIFLCTPLFGQFQPGTFIKYSDPAISDDVIEYLPKFHSYINWSKGEIVTKYQTPITYNDPNIGRNIANLTEKLKNRLVECSIRAITKVRVSSIFSLDDYFQRDKDIRFRLLSILYSLHVENPTIKNSSILGTLIYPLFGENSVSELFYKNIKRQVVTNYLKKATVDTIYYDTIIIDMVMFQQFTPSLMPQLLDQQGNVIYSMATVNPKILQKKRGVVYFVNSLTDALQHPARGKKIAYIMPAETTGNFSSDIVLFDEDVKKIFSQQRTLDFLNKGNVIIIHAALAESNK